MYSTHFNIEAVNYQTNYVINNSYLSLQVSVPVGNSEHGSLVVAVTTLVTSGATIYLIITMFRQIKQKTD